MMEVPFYLLKPDVDEVDRKGPDPVWIPLRPIKDEWEKHVNVVQEMKLQRQRIINFIKRQRELCAYDSDTEEERERRSRELRNSVLLLKEDEEQQRRQLIEDGIMEQSRQRQKKWEKELTNELHLLNDMKREHVYDYKLTNPIPILSLYTACHNCDETIATLHDIERLVAQRVPRLKLHEFLVEPIVTWYPHMLPLKLNLVEELCHLFRNNIGPTLGVVVGGKQLYVHSILMGMMSKFFNHRNYAHVLYLPGSKITSRTFINIYRWMLEPINSLTLSQSVEMLRAAQFLAMGDLTKQCWRLVHDVVKTTDRILSMYMISQRTCTRIEKAITPYVGLIFLPFVSSREFAALDYPKVRRLLNLDNLCVNSEMEVLYAAVVWLETDWPARKRFAIDLAQAIRFELMPFTFLVVFDRLRDGPKALKYLRKEPQVRRLIYRVLIKHDIHSRLEKFKGNVGQSPREWIYDPGSPYHHTEMCTSARFITFGEFINYIKWLQMTGFLAPNRIKRYNDENIMCC